MRRFLTTVTALGDVDTGRRIAEGRRPGNPPPLVLYDAGMTPIAFLKLSNGLAPAP